MAPGLHLDCYAVCYADRRQAASTTNVLSNNLCTHLRVYVVATVQALEWRVARLLIGFAGAGAPGRVCWG